MPSLLKLFSLYACLCACIYVCVSPPRLLITSGMVWCDIDLLSKFHGFYIGAVVGIFRGHGLSFHPRHGDHPSKSKLVLYKLLIHCNSCLKQL